ncbi:hypothetical protein [Paenibacillus dendrobii]|nr:hypothetical protein [Paenibacillus dendrobii]
MPSGRARKGRDISLPFTAEKGTVRVKLPAGNHSCEAPIAHVLRLELKEA